MPAPPRKRHFGRSAFWQIALLVALALAAWLLLQNVTDNLARRNLDFGFAFLGQRTGFDIPFRLVEWSRTDTYGRALWVCFLNTVLAAGLGIAAATILGLVLGLMRLSSNWLARNVALGLIELIRNTPQLLQIIFIYVLMIQMLPQPRNSISIAGSAVLSVRGLYLPSIEAGTSALWWLAGLALGLVITFRVRRHRFDTPAPARWIWLLPAGILCGLWSSIDGFTFPVLRGFNFVGGVVVPPELIALVGGLALYSSAFIAEIVRSGIEGVPAGQREAARSLGLSEFRTLTLVVMPQAMRVIVPQLTSQYLNLTKSTSLGAAIAYPELVQIYAGTVLNQTGRAIEAMLLVMLVFMAINFATVGLMNWYNHRVAIVER